MDHRIHVADERAGDGLGAAALRPRRRVARHLLVRRALEHGGALELVHGQVLRSPLHGLVARAVQESRDREPLGQVLLVVPAVELPFLVRRHVRPHHQQSGAFLCRHGRLLSGTHRRSGRGRVPLVAYPGHLANAPPPRRAAERLRARDRPRGARRATRRAPGRHTRRARVPGRLTLAPADAGWQRNVCALTLTVFVAFVGFQFFSPFLPLYVHELGVTAPRNIALWSGVLAAVTPAVSGLLGPLVGRLADRFGRKMMLIRSLGGFVVIIAAERLGTYVEHRLPPPSSALCSPRKQNWDQAYGSDE